MSAKQFTQKAHESDALDGFLLVRPVWVDDETVKACKGSLCQQMLIDDIALDAILKLADFQLGTLYDDDSPEDDSLPSYEEIRLRVELAR
ncbi:18090_t:CDS:2, partial [Racocetra fulgida]